jgi:undecaprenyl diphosphate synthase
MNVPSTHGMGIPRHIAIIMDGNGRWAEARGHTRAAGHKHGIGAVRMCIEESAKRGVEALTLFAFSSENWKRPQEEVMSLMGLFMDALDREVAELHKNKVRLRFIGDRRSLSVRLQSRIAAAEELTGANPGLKLQVAVSYGGRWDIVEAAKDIARRCANGSLRVEDVSEDTFSGALALAGVPDPDLLIRTGGETRISNFLLWNLAYTELYFTDRLWPEFDVAAYEAALEFFASRERRFGLTGDQQRLTRPAASGRG